MSKKKFTLQILAVLATLAILLIIGFFLLKSYRFFQKEDKTVLSVLDSETTILLKCDNLKAIVDLKTNKANYLHTFLSSKSIEQMDGFLQFIQSLPYTDEVGRKCPLYIAANAKYTQQPYMYIWELGKKHDNTIKKINSTLKHNFKVEKLNYKQWDVFKIKLTPQAVFYTYNNGLLVFSFNEQLIYSSLNQMSLSETQNATSFEKLLKHQDKNTKFHVYIQADILKQRKLSNQNLFSDEVIWKYFLNYQQSVLHLSFENENIILSGFAYLDTNKDNSFYTTNLHTCAYYHLLPENTSSVFALIGDEYRKINSLKTNKISSYEDFLSMMKPTSVFNVALDKDSVSHLILMRSEDIEEAKFHLFNCLNSSYEDNIYYLDTSYWEGFMVGGIDIPNFFVSRLMLGDEIKRLKAYCIMDEYVVFSDSKEILNEYISMIKHKHCIQNNPHFMETDSYFQEKANVVYYKFLDSTDVDVSSNRFKTYRLQMNHYKENKMFFTLVFTIR
ncbi:MAG: hypothetical protein GX330_01495 [Bacteroidales bacterium]|nr:hypothetical protein [Bacteroidales bacterium]